MKVRVEFTIEIKNKQAIIDEFECGESIAEIRDCVRGHCQFAAEGEIQCADDTARVIYNRRSPRDRSITVC